MEGLAATLGAQSIALISVFEEAVVAQVLIVGLDASQDVSSKPGHDTHLLPSPSQAQTANDHALLLLLLLRSQVTIPTAFQLHATS